MLCAGCAHTERKQAPGVSYGDAVPIGFPGNVRIVEDTPHTFENRTPRILEQVRAAAGSGAVNMLALSGGGSGAAFGAGVLVGWSSLGTRPEFQIVTGVSSGALVAPFAFLGPAWDAKLEEIFSGLRTRNLLQSHWINALFGASLYRGEPLVELADQYITQDLLRSVAAEAARGRQLLVATTDLDKEQTVIWNLGVIAAQGGESARRLFRDVIVASSSIPGVFPPVIIHVAESGAVYDEMHVDGGTTTSLFISPEIARALPMGGGLLRDSNIFVIVNGQFGAPTQTTPLRTMPILRRSITAALQSGSHAAVELALSLAQRDGMHLRVTEIPNDYPFAGPLSVDPVRMKALFDFGVRCTRENKVWETPRQILDRAEFARRTPGGATTECPLP
jgi:predicted acylesterase/phospholipase RssA